MAINEYFNEGYEYDDAVKLALKDTKYVFDLLLNQFNSDSSCVAESDTDDDNDEDQDSE